MLKKIFFSAYCLMHGVTYGMNNETLANNQPNSRLLDTLAELTTSLVPATSIAAKTSWHYLKPVVFFSLDHIVFHSQSLREAYQTIREFSTLKNLGGEVKSFVNDIDIPDQARDAVDRFYRENKSRYSLENVKFCYCLQNHSSGCRGGNFNNIIFTYPSFLPVNPDAQDGILAHEYGHYALNRSKQIAFMQLALPITVELSAYALSGICDRMLENKELSLWIKLPVNFMQALIFEHPMSKGLISRALVLAFGRYHEKQADLFAAQMLGSADNVIAFLQPKTTPKQNTTSDSTGVMQRSIIDVISDTIDHRFLGSTHPSDATRIAYLQEWNKKHKKASPFLLKYHGIFLSKQESK